MVKRAAEVNDAWGNCHAPAGQQQETSDDGNDGDDVQISKPL